MSVSGNEKYFPAHSPKVGICDLHPVRLGLTMLFNDTIGIRTIWCQWHMIKNCGAVSGTRIGRGNRSTQREPVPLPLCPPHFSHYMTWLVSNRPSYGMDQWECRCNVCTERIEFLIFHYTCYSLMSSGPDIHERDADCFRYVRWFDVRTVRFHTQA
jgi:hypothetical protein